MTRYYKLKSRICDVMESVLDKCLTPTTDMIMNLFEIENANINTNHPDFVGSADSLLNLFQEEDAEGGAGGDAPDPDGGTTDKNFGLLKKKPQEAEEMDDFHDVQQEDGAEESKEESKKPSNEAKPARMKQSVNDEGRGDHSELKQSMFESVFGYDPKFLPEKQRQEEVIGANLPAQALRTPYISAARDETLLGGMAPQRD